MKLIIVESPTKARTLSRFLGSGFQMEATMGHIKDLPKSKLGIEIENNFKPEYVELKKKKEVVQKIKSEAKKANEIYLATDPDREGEAIAYHVREIFGEKDIKILSAKKKKNRLISQYPNILISRIVFHEITKEAVGEALKNPREIDKNLVDAQTGRRVLDRLVGYKLSPILWKKIRRGLSAGRVQSVTVRLIVERERVIEAFKPKEYWEILCTVRPTLEAKSTDAPSEFVVQLIKVGEKKAEIKDKKTAERIVVDLEKSDFKVADVKKREVVKNPYPPLTTSTLTQSASRAFFWSAKKTMSIAQSLYEEGLITYHRTDSTHIAASALEKVRSFIKKNYGEKYLPEKARFYKTTSKVAQEAHEAIRPTEVEMTRLPSPGGEAAGGQANGKFLMTNGKFVNDAKKLYGLIWKRFVACQMTGSVYDETTITVLAVSHQPSVINYLLRASGQVMKFDGWKKLYQVSNDRYQVSEEQRLPEVEKEELLQLVKVLPEQKFTEPPARYTEASLIKTLEKLGIGRPSTYAPIISTIQIRQYVEKNEGRFLPTRLGFAVTDFLIKYFPNELEYTFTAKMENNLDDIANGKTDWVKVIAKFWQPLDKKLKNVEKSAKRVKIETEKVGKKCPKCKDGELVIRIGRFGKFISCSRFPDCKYTDKYIQKLGMKCPECKTGEVIIRNTKRGKKFYGCSRYPKCKWASWRKPEKT